MERERGGKIGERCKEKRESCEEGRKEGRGKMSRGERETDVKR